MNNLFQKTLGTQFVNSRRFYCDKTINVSDENDTTKLSDNALPAAKAVGKYQVFRDIDAPVILDVDEERWSVQSRVKIETEVDEFEGVNLESK